MNGNRDLFWSLLEPEYRRAQAYCRKLMGSREEGDDLYQDALVSALVGFDLLRHAEAFRPWLYRIIINAFKNRRKRPWWKRIVPLTTETAEAAAGRDPTLAHIAKRRLEFALRVLSAEDRALVILFEIEGWTAEEIARATGKAGGTIRVRLKRARDRMRTALIEQFSCPRSGQHLQPSTSEDKICAVPKPAEE